MATNAVAYAAAALAGSAYLNARLGVSTDLRQLRYDRAFGARLMKRVKDAGPKCTLYGMFDLVDENVEFLWFEGKTWTYGEFKTQVNRFAQVLVDSGVRNGDFVAVFTTNSPEMLIAILAISRIGGVAPLVNTNLRGETFTHCMDVANAKFMVSTPDLAPHVIGDLPHLTLNLSSFKGIHPKETLASRPIIHIDLASPTQIYQPYQGPSPPKTPADLAVLIYTSGTTGRPKACAIRNMQCLLTSTPLSQDIENQKRYFPLRTYCALPLFHGTALFTGLAYTLGTHSTLAIRRKFSSSQFWSDVSTSRATRVLYIGELCRYLLASPPSPHDRNHSCIVASGNGLRKEIWEEFKTRFGVAEVREFYRSTEGVAKFDNFGFGAQRAGKIGFAGPIRRLLETDTMVVKFDEEASQPYRDPKTGFCIKAKLGQPGEAIGRVKDRKLLTEYLGNERASEEKLLRDVFDKGDCWQRMGDLVVIDREGWIRFHDRIGESFRWKGENVSAGEVRDLICEVEGVQDTVVFGVQLARYDGKAGGATITLKSRSAVDEERFMAGLYAALTERGLPSYAFPRLIRTAPSMTTGVTFKQGTRDEAKKPWSPSEKQLKGENLYWLDGTTYRPLDVSTWTNIERGTAKL